MAGFLPGQRVLTAFGYRPLADLEVGDAVVSGRGRLRLVVRTGSCTLSGALCRLATEANHVLRASADQPVLGRRDDDPPRWWRVDDLRPRDTVAILRESVRPQPLEHIRPREDGDGTVVLHEERSVYAAGLDWVPLVAVDAVPYAGRVQGLEIEDDHSCVIEGLVVAAFLPAGRGWRTV